MKIHKTVSEKVIASNRRNAQHSTGPKNTRVVRYNAVTHGLLVRSAFFTEEEGLEFNQLLEQLRQDLFPSDMLERTLVEEIALTIWKLKIAVRLELDDIRSRPTTSTELLRRLISDSSDNRVAVLSEDAAVQNVVYSQKLGWDVKEVVLRTGGQSGDVLQDPFGAPKSTVGMELRLTSAIERILRYQGSLKRDLYRGIQTLQGLQERRAGSASEVRARTALGLAKQTH